MNHRSSRFTLIELLVVVAIISILASLLLPVLGKARRKAKLITCTNQLKQISLGITLYAGDNDDKLPMTATGSATDPLISSTQCFVLNRHTTGLQTSAVSHYLGSYMPSVRTFYCPLGPAYLEVFQTRWEAGNVERLWCTYSLVWQNTSVGPDSLLEPGSVLLANDVTNVSGGETLTAHQILSAGEPKYDIFWGYAGNLSLRTFSAQTNAVYLDGHVEAKRTSDHTQYLHPYEYVPPWE